MSRNDLPWTCPRSRTAGKTTSHTELVRGARITYQCDPGHDIVGRTPHLPVGPQLEHATPHSAKSKSHPVLFPLGHQTINPSITNTIRVQCNLVYGSSHPDANISQGRQFLKAKLKSSPLSWPVPQPHALSSKEEKTKWGSALDHSAALSTPMFVRPNAAYLICLAQSCTAPTPGKWTTRPRLVSDPVLLVGTTIQYTCNPLRAGRELPPDLLLRTGSPIWTSRLPHCVCESPCAD